MASVVDEFVKEWPEREESWERLAKTVANICEEGLKLKLRLKCNITYRAKAQSSLKASIERRALMQPEQKFAAKNEIEKAMIDLAGVRITLAFPREIGEVRRFLDKEFGVKYEGYWGLDQTGKVMETESRERFVGYRATHFHIAWKMPESRFDCKISTREHHIGKTVEI
jgi:ppGpp synthetase/RelA/SpoT-type nucleotidyltranferase